MSLHKSCPGAVTFRDVRPEYIECPFCGVETEIWSDEPFTCCPNCRREIIQSRDASCVDWCSYARQCVGEEKYERLRQMLANATPEASAGA